MNEKTIPICYMKQFRPVCPLTPLSFIELAGVAPDLGRQSRNQILGRVGAQTDGEYTVLWTVLHFTLLFFPEVYCFSLYFTVLH